MARPHKLQRLIGIVTLFASLFVAQGASAFGTARADKATLDESDKSWKLKMTLDYGSLPDINFVPMLFVFTQTTLFERACTDESKGKPVLNRLPLQNQTPINESLDVGFTDGQGKAFKVTKIDFKIRRDRGFEAGEYTLEVKRASDGKPIGSKVKLTLNGENRPVDRRSMTFAGDNKPKDDPCNPPMDEADKVKPPTKTNDAASPAEPKNTEPVQADGEIVAPPEDTTSGDVPAVDKKQGGCGCRVPGDALAVAPAESLALVGLFGLGLVRLRRRRV